MSFSRESAFEYLREAYRGERLAHAYLLSGPVDSGKRWLAEALAAICLKCGEQEVVSHPDFHGIQPESKSRRIVTDQIRGLDQAVQRKPLKGKMKVVVISDADRMQPQAANAFLKTLEEPPPGSLLLLLSSVPEAMLETVLSRCVEVPLQKRNEAGIDEDHRVISRAIESFLLGPTPPAAADAFRFTRAIQALLGEARERLSSEHEALLKEQSSRYRQTSDSAAWLQDRSEQVKALSEASALRERERMIQIVGDILGQALRVKHQKTVHGEPVVARLAEEFSTARLLRLLDTVESLRRRLAQGVQEALSLESAFLEMVLVSDPV